MIIRHHISTWLPGMGGAPGRIACSLAGVYRGAAV